MSPALRRRSIGAVLALVVCAALGVGFLSGHTIARTASLDTPMVGPGQVPVVVPPAAVAAKRTVVLEGDSSMYGGNLPDQLAPPADIAALDPGDDIIDLAVGGTEPRDLLNRLGPIGLLHPDTIVLWLGDQAVLTNQDPIAFERDYSQLLDRLQAYRLILITPVGTKNTPATVLRPYSDAVRQLATAHRAPVVDLSGMITPTDYGIDDVHLQAAASARVAHLIAAQLLVTR